MNSPLTKYLTGLLLVALSSILICIPACQKAPMNGNLDGQWEVMEVYPEPANKPLEQRLFYNFYMHVCQLTYYGGYFMDGNMTYDEDIIQMDFPYADSENKIEILKQYGVDTNPVWFIVDFPEKNKMILSNETTTIILRKF